jgi:pyruvate formate lyase activating enzyme
MAILRQRRQRGLLDGVVISGGEPTLQAQALEELCRQLKAMGYLLKLDSNGSRPLVLERLLRQKLLDYVALDIKTLPERYAACSLPAAASELRRSINLARQIAHEFRTTAVAPFVRPEDVPALVELTGPDSPWFLQKARGWAGQIIEGALSEAEIAAMAAQARALGAPAAAR